MTGVRDTVVHAYGLINAAEHPPLPDRGIGDTAVRLLPFHTFNVVAGDLPATTFGEAEWAAHGQDPDWLTPVATAHHEVLQQLVEQGDLLPLGLPRIYPDDDALLTALDASRAHLERTWWFLAGQVEWSVQVFATAQTPAEASPAPRSGREYLERRQAQADSRADARQRRQVVLVDIHERLAAETTASVMRRPLDSVVTGRDAPMLLNGAHLVPRDEERRFLGLAEELHDEVAVAAGLRIEATGPWPPYNFVNAADEQWADLTGPAP